jgi:O-acetylserine/cysteine efflux transporter
MSARDMALAALTSVIWGFAFVAAKFGLESFSPAQLTAIRFLIACVPVAVVRPPRIPWWSVVLVGSTLYTGQFLLLFFAFTHGLPPGVASVTQQLQAFFTVLLAALFLRDRPDRRQCVGLGIALAGLCVIALTVGATLTLTGLGLGLAAALSWAVGNVLVKRMPDVPAFPLVVWASLAPPLPALLLSSVDARHAGLLDAVRAASGRSLAAAVYLGAFATIASYAIWSRLLQRYPAGAVAPFALLAPCAGVLSSAVILGEAFSALRLAGMALILAGVAVSVLPPHWMTSRAPRPP